jgi:hypothetical protein
MIYYLYEILYILIRFSLLLLLLTPFVEPKASSAANIPITMLSAKGGSSKNEIYVDIVERLTVLFNSSGYVVGDLIYILYMP